MLEYGKVYGIFCEDGRCRLDIGTDAMKKNVLADHNSWATRLIIKNLNGQNSGPVKYGDVVGIFSEDGRCRLDIGLDAVKKEVPADHNSWATRLIIKNLNGDNSGPVHYGDVVGIFSEDGRYRLDIGLDAVKKEVPASHDSWATRLKFRELYC